MTTAEVDTQHPDHDDKTVTIVVNTREHSWDQKEISFEQVFELAYPGHQLADGETVTIQYSRGPNEKPKGSLTANHSVKVKNKMVFDVYLTTRS
ncbi:multiubiquitin domain-containing protein [Lentzea sp. NPDC004789]